MFAPNLDSQILKNRAARFLKNCLSRLLSMFDPMLHQLGSMLAPKIHPKIGPKRHQKIAIPGSIFWSSWLHFGNQVETQEPLKTDPKRPQDATKTAQEPQEHTRSELDRCLVPNHDGVPPPSLDFRSLLARVGTTVGAKFALRDFWKETYKWNYLIGNFTKAVNKYMKWPNW